MRAIAAEADVQPAAIYHWYAGKEAILVALQDDFMERLTEASSPPWRGTTAPALRLAAAVREHVVFHGLHRAGGVRHRQRDPRARRTSPRRR